MRNTILKLYDFIRLHRLSALAGFLLLTGLLVAQLLRLDCQEDISAFLPLGNRHQEALQVYQDISGANRLFAVFQQRDNTETDPDVLVRAIEQFAQEAEEQDSLGYIHNLTAQADLSQRTELADFLYRNIPLFLTADDYARITSLLDDADFYTTQLRQDKQLLLLPSGGLLSENIQRDPLNLFTPVLSRLQGAPSAPDYETYDGCIFSADMTRGIVLMQSPFGSSETENNARLLAFLEGIKKKVEAENPAVDLHFTGGPCIAVGNASRIKSDSLLSVSVSVILIFLLLLVSFRSWRNLLLIALSIGWGWLFAIAGVALLHDQVSVIVIGISSVILGIAVNYPLHLLAHLEHTPDVRNALKEIITPLTVGNITTVGAFLCLVPLKSAALRDLGLFSSFLLVGTILFVALCLPHLVKRKTKPAEHLLFRMGEVKPENHRWLVAGVGVLTVFFGYFSLQTTFDADISHMNYMTPGQKADMAYLSSLTSRAAETENLYVVSTDTTFDAAIDRSRKATPLMRSVHDKVLTCNSFLSSRAEQQERIDRWNAFVSEYGARLEQNLDRALAAEGFSLDQFDEFREILHSGYSPQPLSYFQPLTTTAFSTFLSLDSLNHRYSVVDILPVKPGEMQRVKDMLEERLPDANIFDVPGMNAALARNLSDHFNYIGWACGFIVFFFLWFSMGSLELAALSFLPMAVSWIWILGLMALFDIQFNIVNIILATFIFGQGDDYTIFMTEGSCYEYATRRKMLASYKSSIILSALIMFIGIGTLILARHPALHSLAQVTMVGMFSVVLMAYLFPPLIFRWLVMKDGQYRRQPLTLRYLWRRLCGQDTESRTLTNCKNILKDRYMYKGYSFENAPGADILLQAMMNPHRSFIIREPDEEKRLVIRYTAEGLVTNITLQ